MKFVDLLDRANDRLFIIAEAGVNHNGDVETALRLVDAAIDSGCDAIKFQTWITEKVYSTTLSVKPEYQARVTDARESEFDTIKRLESFNAEDTPKEGQEAFFSIEIGAKDINHFFFWQKRRETGKKKYAFRT